METDSPVRPRILLRIMPSRPLMTRHPLWMPLRVVGLFRRSRFGFLIGTFDYGVQRRLPQVGYELRGFRWLESELAKKDCHSIQPQPTWLRIEKVTVSSATTRQK